MNEEATGTATEVAPAETPAAGSTDAPAPDAPTTTKDKLASVRESLAAGKTLSDVVAAEEASSESKPVAAEKSVPTRDEKGRFASQEKGEGEAEGEHAEETESAAGAEAGETETPQADEATGTEGASEEETAGEDEEEGAEGADAFLVEIPGRRPDDEPLEIEVQDQATSDLLRAAIKGGMRRREFEDQLTEVAAGRDELNDIRDEIASDPAGFVRESMRTEDQIHLARQLILGNDDVYQALSPELDRLQLDPGLLEQKKIELENEQLKAQSQARQRMEWTREARDMATNAAAGIRSLADGNSLEAAKAERFNTMAMDFLAQHVEEKQLRQLTPDKAVELLDGFGILADLGIDPKKRTTHTKIRTTGSAPRSSAAPAPDDGRGTDARRTGARLRESSDRRKSAASTAPAGAGAPPVQHSVTPGQGVKERIKEFRKKGGSLYGR